LGARREISDEELWETLDAFGMKSVTERQYKELDTEIGVQSDFSGGQRQLLVLARVFLQDRPVAIFDEGTNQLDAENEARVMRLLLLRRRDRINIFITHRIATIRDVARIYCLERGHITAVGTSDELLAAGDNAYARFVRIGSGEWSDVENLQSGGSTLS
jgi:ATP-binding cassette, subfamily B, bacterial